MSVTAIVVNYNAGTCLERCLRALMSGSVQCKVRLIDNASVDGSAQALQNLYGNQSNVEFLFNASNVGFARAVNSAVKAANTEFVWVVNPDCIVEPSTLERLLEAVRADDNCALAAPAVKSVNGMLEKASFRRFPDPWNSLMTMTGLWRLGRWFPAFRGVPVNAADVPEETCQAEAVSGSCMLIRRELMINQGLLDEQFEMHCEDLDLMYRFSSAGMHCLYVPHASATHEQGVSSASRPLWVHLQKHKGMARFFNLHLASRHSFVTRAIVHLGIWSRYIVLIPLVLIRR